MHLALRTVLGTHGAERIVVNPNNLRFDFSHFSKVTDEELQQEDFVNARIRAITVERRDIPFASSRRGSNGFVW
jgi:alanyl-tRNA synthetase